MLVDILTYICYVVGCVGLVTYFIPVIAQLFLRDQNLKTLYGAEWALVTGASSGIGKELVLKLASNGINVVLVALDDKLLATTFAEVQALHPALKFRVVPCNLGSDDYLPAIIDATTDIDVRLVFCNAGYIVPGIFHLTPLNAQLSNFNCNAKCSVVLTHHFLTKLKDLPLVNGKRGLIAYTSSSAGFLPSPIASLYGSTKAFVTSFATAIATEVKEDGIDVVCVHPSPIRSNFFNPASNISLFTMFQKTAMHPRVIADIMFQNAGKFVLVDQGYFSVGTKILLKAVDWNFMGEVAPYFMKYNKDFRALKDKKDKVVTGNKEE